MRHRVWLCVALVGCWTDAPVAFAPPISIPTPLHSHATPRGPYADLLGKWSGHGFQYDNNSDWDIVLTFDPIASIGDQVGTVEYPGLECGGILIRRPEHDDGTLVVQERITHGTRCIDRGTFQFARHPIGRQLAWKWYAPDTGEEQAQGTVHQ